MSWKNKTELDASPNKPHPNIYDWLVKPNNLTETIKKTGAAFSLQVLNQSIGKPFADEINAFNKYPITASVALIRNVLLKADTQPVIFARVIVPESTYLNYQDAFNTLGNAPIGNTLLYNNPCVLRKQFEYKLLNSQDSIFLTLQTLHPAINESNLWSRRSVFIMKKEGLLITEVFLNTIPLYPTA